MHSCSLANVLAVLLVLSCSCQPVQQPMQTQPVSDRSYSLSQTTIDLGRLRLGESKDFRLELNNHTKQSLPFVGFQTSCSCSNLRVSDKNIPAQGKATIEGQFRAQQLYGVFRREIKVQCEANDTPAVLLLTGEVYRELTFEPEALVLKPHAIDGQGDSGQVRLRNRSDRPVRFKFDARHDGITWEMNPPELAAGQTGILTVRANGAFLSPVQLEMLASTSHPAETLLKIPVHIAPQSPLKVHPSVFNWGVISQNDWQKLMPLEVRLLGPTLEAYQVEQMELPAFLAWTNPTGYRKNKDQSCFQLGVKPGVALPIDLNNVIIFHLRHKNSSTTSLLRIPMSGLLRDRQNP